MIREMKDSGIEWIGRIPKSWAINRIKFLANDDVNSFIDGDWIESPYITESGIRYLTTGNIGDGVFKNQGDGFISLDTFKNLKCKYAYPEDLVFSRLNAPYGRSCLLPKIENEFVLAVDNVILRTDHNKKFICFLTQCEGYQHSVEDLSAGTTMKRISRTNLGKIKLPIPPEEEQKEIANFLDSKCSQIDSLLSKIRDQIDTFEQYKKSVITEAVTKGLNADVEMKDSGVEWIGMIPKNWAVKPLKYNFTITSGSTPQSTVESYWDGDIIWVTPADFKTNDYYLHTGKRNISKEGLKSCSTSVIPENSIIFSKRAPIGSVVINAVSLCTNQGCLACVPKTKIDIRFYYFLISVYEEVFNLFGVGTTFREISASTFGNIKFAKPSYYEQKEIADYLDNKCSKIDSIILDKKKQLETLEQYKKSLIYEYVTGKKEVK